MMSGEVTSIDAEVCRGWAAISLLPKYAVTVHLVLDDRVYASAIADGAAETPDRPEVLGDCWFELKVSPDIAPRLSECRVLIGESGDYLRDAKRQSGTEVPSPVSARQAPTSFRDGLDRGLSAADVLELLYLDVLRRPADKKGMRSRLHELDSGQGSFESFRRSLLDSEEYRRLTLRVREAPGGTFSRDIAYASSSRRSRMEQHATAFQRSDAPLRIKLFDFLPGLVAIPSASESLVTRAEEGLPERETFHRALSALSRRPSLIVPTRCELVRGQGGDALPRGQREVSVDCGSPLFCVGWNRLERASNTSFRWMEQVGVILHPYPERRIERCEVSVEGWYADLDRAVTGVADGMVLACERRDAEGGGSTLVFASPDGTPFTATRIALVAGGAACPWRYDGTPDMRLISCQVTTVRFLYDAEAT